MSWFQDSAASAVNRIPPNVINVGGDVIRDALGLGSKGGPTGPVRQIKPGDNEYHTSFSAFLTDIRRRGVAKQNRYIVMLSVLPPKLVDETRKAYSGQTQATSLFSKSLEFITADRLAFFTRSCESASFPGINIQTQETRHQSYLSKMPTLSNYNETSWTFRCDNEMLEKKFFDLWVGCIVNKNNGDISYKDDYSVNAEVIQFDEHGKATYAIVLEKFYPIQMGDMDLQQNGTDYHRLNVTFAYDKIYIKSLDNPDYSSGAVAKAGGLRSLTPYDRVVNEVFKAGKNLVLKEVGKNSPIANVPGVGTARDLLGGFGI